MVCVYVSGPYTHPDPCENTKKAVDAGNVLLDHGIAPLVPHLSHFWHTMTPRPYADWMALDLAWVLKSDAVLRLPGRSSGADQETELAIKNGIPVFHNIDILLSWAQRHPAHNQ